MFKVGDRIVCTDDASQGMRRQKLIKNESYTVEKVEDGFFLKLKDLPHLWLSDRFIPLGDQILENAVIEPFTSKDHKIVSNTVKMTLPTDSNERKNFPLFHGVLKYFPAALSGVAKISKSGNDKHNPGQELHHARGKSIDHGDCIIRHLMDTADLLAAQERGEAPTQQAILNEVSQLTWRALAFSQELHEKFGAPLAPGAKK